MKRKFWIILVVGVVSLVSLRSSFSQEPTVEVRTKVGGLKLPDQTFGSFGAARHINKDSTFTGYVNYHAEFALWLGARNSQGKILVSAGSGNELTHQPEWTPVIPELQVETENLLPQVEKRITTTYSDAVAFEGHEPLGVRVEQKVYGFRNSGFAVLDLTVSLEEKAKALTDVYVGFWSDVDAPNSEDKKSPANDKVGLALRGTAPFIFDGSITGNEVPLLGAKILGAADPIVSWWTVENDPLKDDQKYDYLQGNVPVSDLQMSGDYRLLVSYGPLSLKPGETIRFPVTLVQASQVSDFEDNLNDAEEFFTEELGGVALEKQVTAFEQSAALEGLPETFRLYPNFPNPFNPETRIQFDLPQAEHVELRIYNTLGQLVRTLVDQPYSAGSFSVIWDGRDDNGQPLASGIYIYKMTAGAFTAQHKLLLLK
jgi:hypothetical protein